MTGLDYADFDRYCDDRGIAPGEEPAAFAAWLHEISGGTWDGDAAPVAKAGSVDEPEAKE